MQNLQIWLRRNVAEPKMYVCLKLIAFHPDLGAKRTYMSRVSTRRNVLRYY
jgi:hypothetical protein